MLRNGNFEFLGVAIGSKEHCGEHLQARVDKLVCVFDALAAFPDPQVALRLLRNCHSFSKVAFSASTTTPHLHMDQLQDFDQLVRRTLSSFFPGCI